MRRFAMTICLTCGLAASTIAGEIPSVPKTPPPDGIQTVSTTSPGEIPTVGYTQQISDAALNLIQIMLGAGI